MDVVRAAVRVTLTLVLALWLVLGFSLHAGAHTELLGASPGPGAQVTGDLGRVELVFSDELRALGSDVVVLDPSGAPVRTGPAAVLGAAVVVTIPELAPGEHELLYRVTGVDGHPIVGRYEFIVAAGVGPGAAERATTPADPGATRSEVVGAGTSWLWAAMPLAGVLVALHWMRRARASRHP